jgi:hypothetical protein
MNEVVSAKLITTATVFGSAAVACTVIPFMLVLISGIVKANQPGSTGASYVNIAGFAFIVHIISCYFFMGTIYVLDIVNRMHEQNYYTEKVFGLFWTSGKSAVLTAAGGGETIENAGAYTVLNAIQTMSEMLFAIMPIIVLISSMAYGVALANKDTYRQDNLTVLVYAAISCVIGSTVYTAWAYIASLALFIPEGNLFTLITDFWKESFQVGN